MDPTFVPKSFSACAFKDAASASRPLDTAAEGVTSSDCMSLINPLASAAAWADSSISNVIRLLPPFSSPSPSGRSSLPEASPLSKPVMSLNVSAIIAMDSTVDEDTEDEDDDDDDELLLPPPPPPPLLLGRTTKSAAKARQAFLTAAALSASSRLSSEPTQDIVWRASVMRPSDRAVSIPAVNPFADESPG